MAPAASSPTPSDALRAFAAPHLPAHVQYEWCGHPHGEAAVWRAEAAGRTLAFLKHHHSAGQAARERNAYRDWANDLPGAPRLLAAENGPHPALLLSALPGVPAPSADLDGAGWVEVHRRAGRFAHALHTTPLQHADPLPLSDALAARMDRWLARARRLVPAAIADAVAQRFDTTWADGMARVPTHRDFAPYNWIVAGNGNTEVGVVDFGHSRPDLWLADVAKLAFDAWTGRPELRDAFFDGYGRPPTPEETAGLHQVGLLHGLATLVWALEHGDRAAAETGRSVLAHVGVRVSARS